MAWRRRSTFESVDVDVDVDDFETAVLLQALIEQQMISEDEAEAILSRNGIKRGEKGTILKGPTRFPSDEFEMAEEEIRRGRVVEALIHVERFLGREWIGRLVGQ
jgi:hypothetical protein